MTTEMDLVKNRYCELNCVAKDSTGAVMSIANPVEIQFTMTSIDDPTQTLAKTSAVGAEITKTNPAAGLYTIYILIADTDDLPAGYYKWEIAFIDAPLLPVEVYNLNPTASEYGTLLLKDKLIEVTP